MDIGLVKWFGRYDFKRDRKNNFGFIYSLTSKNDVYFNRSNICKESSLKGHEDKIFENELLAYEVQPSRRDADKVEATQVMYVEELSVDQIRSIPMDILEDKRVKDKLLDVHPEIYLRNEPREFFPYFEKDSVRRLFVKNNKCGHTSQSIFLELIEYICSTRSLRWDDLYWECFDFSTLPESDFCSLLNVANKKGMDTRYLYLKHIDKWINNSQCISNISSTTINWLMNAGWQPSIEHVLALLDSLQQRKSKELLCNKLPINIIKNTPQTLEYISDEKIKDILSSVDWNNRSTEYMKTIRSLLYHVEADVHVSSATHIAEMLFSQNLQFSSWWHYLQDSVKIRILIYCSNFPEKKGEWVTNIREVYRYEKQQDSQLIITVLMFLKILYLGYEYDKKQELFELCHERLMKYIADCYNKRIDVTHALNTLLEKCHDFEPGDEYYFCDARIWKKEESIFCPEGKSRPCSRRKCTFFNGTDLTKTHFQSTHNYSHQYLTDFIQNLDFKPNLHKLGISNNAEYAYRVSAYVNRLLDMRPHMQCSCGEWFHADFRYAKLITAKLSATVFDCPKYAEDPSGGHDCRVYLNYCYHCHKVIDSRECKIQDEKNYYLCMKCGGTASVQPGTKCPNCGTTEKSYLKYSGHLITCDKCGHNKNKYLRLGFSQRLKLKEKFHADTAC